jgi:hypothetical protein
MLIPKRSHHNIYPRRVARRHSHARRPGHQSLIHRRSRHSYRLWIDDRSTRQQLREWNREQPVV